MSHVHSIGRSSVSRDRTGIVSLPVRFTCGGDEFIWATARRRTLGLAGMWFNSVSALTVSHTLPGDVRPVESSKYAGGGGKLSDDEVIILDCICCDEKRAKD